MRVAVTCECEYSVFSCGTTNTSIALAELMQGLGHTTTLINFNNKQVWWDDCVPIQKLFKITNLEDIPISDTPAFDLVLEVGLLTLTEEQRKKFAAKSIWVIRKPFVLSEIEMCIFPTISKPRNLEGLFETWLLNDVSSPDDVTALETITRARVRQLPFVWTPLLAEAHFRSFGAKQWSAIPDGKLNVHMVDTNTTSSSSSTLPLVILREAARRTLPIESWKLHNGEMIEKSRFFRENIVKHCSDFDLSGTCVGRQRCVEWTTEPNSVALMHLRFRGLRPVLLDLAWVGVPVVHNSPVFRDIGFGAERFYYTDNGVYEAVNALNNVLTDMKTGVNWFANFKERREQILRRWSPMSPSVRAEWSFHLNQVMPVVSVTPVSVTPVSVPKEYNVVFSDMWDGFQADYNFFTLLLSSAGLKLRGIHESEWTSAERPHLVICGPFGHKWIRFEGVPKVFFTGENSPPLVHPDVKLNLGYGHLNMTTDSYLRLPLWMTEIDWFGANIERLVNPLPIPLELCTKTHETTFEERQKFCSFIVTNPRNQLRNQAFHWLNSYKPVDSGGNLFNTIGNELMAMKGGGGGEIKKTQFMMNYRFALAYENSASSGYCTEKYLHAKAAGAVPIYWGDPDFQRDFDPAGCIDARNIKTPEELIAKVKECETEEEWKKRAAVPALDPYRVELARRTLAECAKRIYTILGEDAALVPKALGATSNSPQASAGMELFVRKPIGNPLQVPVIVTYVTCSFLGSLQHWLLAAKAQLRAFPNMRAIVFMGADVLPETVLALSEKYTFVDFERVPFDWTPPNFPDFWEGSNFGWKLWIYSTLVNRESLKGKLILYMDAGSVLVRWPTQWMLQASEHGVACLEDPREENDRWCGDLFCERLKVTDAERSSKQIVAGIMCFMAGNPKAKALFDDAFTLAQDRDILVGPRLSGVAVDGKSYGHRQDQSILSILVRRHMIAMSALDTVYCDYSMRKTFQSGRSIYVHRGNFNKSIPFIQGIEDAFVINLDRREDRMEAFWSVHPELVERVNRVSAYDGRSLTLTPELRSLFKPNDFFWKKSVMGCALSHLSLWWKLVNEHPDIHNYLIFEDDAKLSVGWEETLSKSMAHIPEDYDVLYLGGILPPNRGGFEKLLEPVTKYYSRIKPHQFFGQPTPTRYFHSCAYAYILSRNGAIKIMDALKEHNGYWTSADHIMCSPCDKMNLYFLTTPVAGCFQDSDPAYANSDFNNFSRIDKFDSDLWNNDERFSAEECAEPSQDFDISTTLTAIYDRKSVAATSVAATSVQATSVAATSVKPLESKIITKSGRVLNTRFVTIKENPLDFAKIYERDWLFALFGNVSVASIEQVDETTPLPTDCPIMLMMRPHTIAITKLLHFWSENGVKFKILHLSDELQLVNARDPLIAYTFKGCVSVLRFYVRDDFPPGTESKIQVIPLGFRFSNLNLTQPPLQRTPQIPFRELHWSFYGTDWNRRSESMKPLLESKLISSYKFYKGWNDSENLSRDEYLSILMNTVFVPCPDGCNPETFRFYEALDAGCIPLVLKTPNNTEWFNWVSNYIPLIEISSWEDAHRIMISLLSRPSTLEIYRNKILTGWTGWTNELKVQAEKWLTEQGLKSN